VVFYRRYILGHGDGVGEPGNGKVDTAVIPGHRSPSNRQTLRFASVAHSAQVESNSGVIKESAKESQGFWVLRVHSG
jgi:hypothetical protein